MPGIISLYIMNSHYIQSPDSSFPAFFSVTPPTQKTVLTMALLGEILLH